MDLFPLKQSMNIVMDNCLGLGKGDPVEICFMMLYM